MFIYSWQIDTNKKETSMQYILPETAFSCQYVYIKNQHDWVKMDN